jgi:hypothetical protein
MLTGSNGEPDAKITLPFVHSYACAAVHSALRRMTTREGFGGYMPKRQERKAKEKNRM